MSLWSIFSKSSLDFLFSLCFFFSLLKFGIGSLHAKTASSNKREAAIVVDPGDDGVAELEEGTGVQDTGVRLGLPPADPPADSSRLEEGADQVEEGTSFLNADGLAFLPPSENIALV